MSFLRGLLRFVLITAGLCSVLAVGRVAHSQTVPITQPEQNAGPSGLQVANTSGISVNDEEFPKGWPLALNILYYRQFLEWVGKEDDRIQQETQEGKQQVTPRIDYASAIGISKEKEQAILPILIDAYHKREENKKRYQQADIQLAIEEGDAKYLGHPHHEYQAMLKANRVILDDTYTKLKQILGQEDFKKLDKYVDREFAAAAYPASLRAAQRAGNSEPPITPFPTDVRYEFFIRHVGTEHAFAQRETQAGEVNVPREDYSLAAHIPEVEEQPLLTIVLESCEQLNENDRETNELVRKIHEKYGFVPLRRIPPQPDLQALQQKREAIIQETIVRLKQELGEEYFKDLDAWITHHWYGGQVYTPIAPAGNQPSLQTPGVRP